MCNGRVSPARRRAGAASGAAGPLPWCGSARVEDPRRRLGRYLWGAHGCGRGWRGGLVWGPPPLHVPLPTGGGGSGGGPGALPRASQPRVRSRRTAGPDRGELRGPARRGSGGPARGEPRGYWPGGAHGDPAGSGGGWRSGSAAGAGGGPGRGSAGAGRAHLAGRRAVIHGRAPSHCLALPRVGAGGCSRWVPFVTGFRSPKFRRREEGGQGSIAASPERRRYGRGPGPAPVVPRNSRKENFPPRAGARGVSRAQLLSWAASIPL